ncbi:MAG: Crp/Fnr family transcriptional regulator [bacterium]
MMNEYCLWSKSKLFEDLPKVDVQEIISYSRDLAFSKNQFIYLMGTRANAIFLLKKGRVKISVLNNDGKEKIIDIFHPGESFGEFSVHGGHRYETEAMALENVRVYKLDHRIFIDLLRQKPQFALNCINLLNDRLIEARTEIEELSYKSAHKRLTRILLKLAQKYGKSDGDHIQRILKISHEHLAEMTGSNRSYISSFMSEFKKNGIISYNARYLVIHTNLLETYL